MNRDDFPVELIEPFAEHLALKTIEEIEIKAIFQKLLRGIPQ